LEGIGIKCVGPRRDLARIESSKAFARQLQVRHGIAGQVKHRVFSPGSPLSEVEAYLRSLGEYVLKPDGLTGGKGVRVFGDQLHSLSESLEYAQALLGKGLLIVEERLDGEEFSLQSLCDGEHVVHTMPVQDHKRALEQDRGDNTGGMGSYSCADHLLPFLTRADVDAACAINTAVAHALRAELGHPYKGVLYGGFMATADGVRLIEYNARFGDPEAMNVLSVLSGNFLDVCRGIIEGTLDRCDFGFRRKATVCKYLVPEGYPGKPVRGMSIDLRAARYLQEKTPGLRLYYAAVEGTLEDPVLTGSRAIAIVASAETLEAAEHVVESAAMTVRGPVRHRADIGTKELIQRRINHMAALRGKSGRRMEGSDASVKSSLDTTRSC